MLKIFSISLLLCFFALCQTVLAGGINLEAVFPYSLEHKNINRTNGNATNPLFINIESFDSPEPQNVKVEIMLPQGLIFIGDELWQEIKSEAGSVILRIMGRILI